MIFSVRLALAWSYNFIRSHKNRLDIRRNSLQIIQRAPQHRPQDAEFVLQFLSASIVAFGFDREQIMIKLAHPCLNFSTFTANVPSGFWVNASLSSR